MEQAEDQRTERDQQQLVAREARARDLDGIGESRRARAEQVLRPPGPEGEIASQQDEAKGGEQLQQLGRLVQPAQHQHLDRRAGERHERRGERHAQPISHLGREPHGEVHAEHV